MAGKWPVIDRIWRSRGSIIVDEQVSANDALDRLSGLFDPDEMTVDRVKARIDYRKPNPAAQDRLATFSSGSLELAEANGRREVRFDVGSPALLLTFLAPLLFLALGQGIVALGQWEETKAAAQDDKDKDEEDKDEDQAELHWFDQMLGAPAPEKPDKDKDKAEEKDEEDDDYSPKQAYGLAALFALIYLVGRFLEPRLFRRTLRRAISGPEISRS